MARYRKKPIVIEAEQWIPGKRIEGVYTRLKNINVDIDVNPYIDTLEGRMSVSTGDWIITGIAGEKYPCKDTIFQGTYDKIEECDQCSGRD